LVSIIYVQLWHEAPLTRKASLNDVQLLETLANYLNTAIAKAEQIHLADTSGIFLTFSLVFLSLTTELQASRIREQGRRSTTVEEVSRAYTFSAQTFCLKNTKPHFRRLKTPQNDVPFYTACCPSIIDNFAGVPLRKSFIGSIGWGILLETKDPSVAREYKRVRNLVHKQLRQRDRKERQEDVDRARSTLRDFGCKR